MDGYSSSILSKYCEVAHFLSSSNAVQAGMPVVLLQSLVHLLSFLGLTTHSLLAKLGSNVTDDVLRAFHVLVVRDGVLRITSLFHFISLRDEPLFFWIGSPDNAYPPT